MTIKSRQLSLLLLGVALAACDSTSMNAPMGNEPMPHDTADAGGMPGPEPGEDAGVVDAPIPIEVWVDDLVENHTTDEALPDTVDDKNIKDSEDPALFDKYFDAQR